MPRWLNGRAVDRINLEAQLPCKQQVGGSNPSRGFYIKVQSLVFIVKIKTIDLYKFLFIYGINYLLTKIISTSH